MLLKRIFKEGTNELDYLSIGHTGVTPEQNFSVRLVTELLGLGHMEIHDDELILRAHPEDLHYEIKRMPGRYCLHCGEKLPDDIDGSLARLHIALKHAGVPSPDSDVPAGYVAINQFECVLNEEQHERFRVRKAARAVHFPLKEA